MKSIHGNLWQKAWHLENKALDLYLENRYLECILVCQEILSYGLEEFAFDAHRRIGLCHYYLYHWDESLAALRQALRRRPTDVRIRTYIKRVQDILTPPRPMEWSSRLRPQVLVARAR